MIKFCTFNFCIRNVYKKRKLSCYTFVTYFLIPVDLSLTLRLPFVYNRLFIVHQLQLSINSCILRKKKKTILVPYWGFRLVFDCVEDVHVCCFYCIEKLNWFENIYNWIIWGLTVLAFQVFGASVFLPQINIIKV